MMSMTELKFVSWMKKATGPISIMGKIQCSGGLITLWSMLMGSVLASAVVTDSIIKPMGYMGVTVLARERPLSQD